MPVINGIWFRAYRKVISRKVVYFIRLQHLRLSRHLFHIIILTSLVNCRNEEQRNIRSSTQDIMGKKGKAPSSEEKEMAPLYTDTACNKDAGIFTWEGMYNLLEEENPRVMEVEATAGSHSSSEASITELACSFLHQIAARPKILPYIDLVKWILDSTDIKSKQFKTQGQELADSLFSQNLSFISAKRKRAKGKKTHQGSLDQETEAVSDAQLIAHRWAKLLEKESF